MSARATSPDDLPRTTYLQPRARELDSMDEVLTTKEAAAFLKVSQNEIRLLDIPRHPIGKKGRFRWLKSELVEYIRQQQPAPSAAITFKRAG